MLFHDKTPDSKPFIVDSQQKGSDRTGIQDSESLLGYPGLTLSYLWGKGTGWYPVLWQLTYHSSDLVDYRPLELDLLADAFLIHYLLDCFSLAI